MLNSYSSKIVTIMSKRQTHSIAHIHTQPHTNSYARTSNTRTFSHTFTLATKTHAHNFPRVHTLSQAHAPSIPHTHALSVTNTLTRTHILPQANTLSNTCLCKYLLTHTHSNTAIPWRRLTKWNGYWKQRKIIHIFRHTRGRIKLEDVVEVGREDRLFSSVQFCRKIKLKFCLLHLPRLGLL